MPPNPATTAVDIPAAALDVVPSTPTSCDALLRGGCPSVVYAAAPRPCTGPRGGRGAARERQHTAANVATNVAAKKLLLEVTLKFAVGLRVVVVVVVAVTVAVTISIVAVVVVAVGAAGRRHVSVLASNVGDCSRAVRPVG